MFRSVADSLQHTSTLMFGIHLMSKLSNEQVVKWQLCHGA